MKKYVYILLTFVLLLGGCASKPAEQPAATTDPATIPTTAPTQATQTTTVPTTAPTTEPTTVPTTEPTTPPTTETTTYPNENIMLFWYHGTAPFIGMKVDTSQCVIDHLYAFDKNTQKTIAVSDSTIVTYNHDDSFVYFVKTSEPTRIYAQPKIC